MAKSEPPYQRSPLVQRHRILTCCPPLTRKKSPEGVVADRHRPDMLAGSGVVQDQLPAGARRLVKDVNGQLAAVPQPVGCRLRGADDRRDEVCLGTTGDTDHTAAGPGLDPGTAVRSNPLRAVRAARSRQREEVVGAGPATSMDTRPVRPLFGRHCAGMLNTLTGVANTHTPATRAPVLRSRTHVSILAVSALAGAAAGMDTCQPHRPARDGSARYIPTTLRLRSCAVRVVLAPEMGPDLGLMVTPSSARPSHRLLPKHDRFPHRERRNAHRPRGPLPPTGQPSNHHQWWSHDA